MSESSEPDFKMPMALSKPKTESKPIFQKPEKLENSVKESVGEKKEVAKSSKSPAEILKERSAPPLQYDEPEWKGLPPDSKQNRYSIEELKNGTIVNEHKLVGKFHFLLVASKYS